MHFTIIEKKFRGLKSEETVKENKLFDSRTKIEENN